MALEHQFMMLAASHLIDSDKDSIYSFVEKCQTYAISEFCVDDSYLQALLFDEDGLVKDEISFNEWGITIIEKEEQAKWIARLQSEKGKGVANCLLDFFLYASSANMTIVHFGV